MALTHSNLTTLQQKLSADLLKAQQDNIWIKDVAHNPRAQHLPPGMNIDFTLTHDNFADSKLAAFRKEMIDKLRAAKADGRLEVGADAAILALEQKLNKICEEQYNELKANVTPFNEQRWKDQVDSLQPEIEAILNTRTNPADTSVNDAITADIAALKGNTLESEVTRLTQVLELTRGEQNGHIIEASARNVLAKKGRDFKESNLSLTDWTDWFDKSRYAASSSPLGWDVVPGSSKKPVPSDVALSAITFDPKYDCELQRKGSNVRIAYKAGPPQSFKPKWVGPQSKTMLMLNDYQKNTANDIFGWIAQLLALIFGSLLDLNKLRKNSFKKEANVRMEGHMCAAVLAGATEALPFEYDKSIDSLANFNNLKTDFKNVLKLKNEIPPILLEFNVDEHKDWINNIPNSPFFGQKEKDAFFEEVALHNAEVKKLRSKNESLKATHVGNLQMVQQSVADAKTSLANANQSLANMRLANPADPAIPAAERKVLQAQVTLAKAEGQLADINLIQARADLAAATAAHQNATNEVTRLNALPPPLSADDAALLATALAAQTAAQNDVNANQTIVDGLIDRVAQATQAQNALNGLVAAEAALAAVPAGDARAQAQADLQKANADIAHSDWNMVVADRALQEANAVIAALPHGTAPTAEQLNAVDAARNQQADAVAQRTAAIGRNVVAQQALATQARDQADRNLADLTARVPAPSGVELATAMQQIEAAKVEEAKVAVAQAFQADGIPVENGVPMGAVAPNIDQNDALEVLRLATQAKGFADAQVTAQTNLETAQTAVNSLPAAPPPPAVRAPAAQLAYLQAVETLQAANLAVVQADHNQANVRLQQAVAAEAKAQRIAVAGGPAVPAQVTNELVAAQNDLTIKQDLLFNAKIASAAARVNSAMQERTLAFAARDALPIPRDPYAHAIAEQKITEADLKRVQALLDGRQVEFDAVPPRITIDQLKDAKETVLFAKELDAVAKYNVADESVIRAQAAVAAAAGGGAIAQAQAANKLVVAQQEAALAKTNMEAASHEYLKMNISELKTQILGAPPHDPAIVADLDAKLDPAPGEDFGQYLSRIEQYYNDQVLDSANHADPNLIALKDILNRTPNRNKMNELGILVNFDINKSTHEHVVPEPPRL